jgi:hypothetical protein
MIVEPGSHGEACFLSRLPRIINKNDEERCGLAFSTDLRRFHRITRRGPLFDRPHAHGSAPLRYFDVLARPEDVFLDYEMARPDMCRRPTSAST